MKTFLTITLLAIGFIARGQIVTNASDAIVHLRMDYPTNQISDDLSFVFYTTTNLAISFTNWDSFQVMATNCATTNLDFGTNRIFDVPQEIKPGRNFQFWTCVASNFWGLSTTSNYAYTPPLPQNPKLKIIK